MFKQSQDNVLNDLDLALEIKRQSTLEIYKKYRDYGSQTIQGLHGVLGLYKPTLVDIVHSSFYSPKQYKEKWLQSLKKNLLEENKYGRRSMILLQNLLRHKDSCDYILLYLERDYYRHLKERLRTKPNQNLWEIWFGGNEINWGLFVAPEKRDNNWINKDKNVRRVSFEYWTIGHVLSTGLIDPENNDLVVFNSVGDLLSFIKSILKRLSRSQYEKAIYDMYIDYINQSTNPMNEPFLIPEFRYAGLERKHIYRLDFTILNIHTDEKVGFEISPQSTHMNVKTINKTKLIDVNKDLSNKWSKEMQKRNDYFSEFDISMITFTDKFF